jgi:predicted metal-dependent hydrolase
MMIPQRKPAKPVHLQVVGGKQQFSFSPPSSYLSQEVKSDLIEEEQILQQQMLHLPIPQKASNATTMLSDGVEDYTKHTLTSYEMEYLKSICNDRKLLNLFKKLSVYFNGQYHEQEIMWLEGVSQEEMNYLLKTFSSVLLLIEQ